MSDPSPLSFFLNKTYEQLDMTEKVVENDVRSAYCSIVGDLISKLTWDLAYYNRTLVVHLSSAALRHELALKKQSLADKINETLGQKAVDNIIFK